ncbi:hypothetical protein [Vibrio minamisatsumaniensis]|uniref:hypothetical protein n=1 Tax=Vibrio minamisatsumaniensis TaxID=2910243 RepID=UPI003D234461
METATSHARVIDAQVYQQLEAILAQKIETERIITQEAKHCLTQKGCLAPALLSMTIPIPTSQT